MRMILLLHIVTGALGLLSGYVALYAAKGATLHRKSGVVFVSVMITMAVSGMLISAVEGAARAINIPTALLTLYLVITSLTTVRPFRGAFGQLDVAAMLMASAVAPTCFVLGITAIVNGGREAGIAYPLFLFGGIALTASVGDLRMIRAGGVYGASRLKRHLWRMCFALTLAAMAFFMGQADVFPPPLRIRPLLALPMLAVLTTMFFWFWRLRVRRSVRKMVGVAPATELASRVDGLQVLRSE
jgi:uncharacterized membrane protein